MEDPQEDDYHGHGGRQAEEMDVASKNFLFT